MFDRDFSSFARPVGGREKRFGMFRLTSVIAFVAIAIWLFLGGPHSRLPYDSTPRWLLETPSWILGGAALGLAILAAVLPAERIETALWHLLLYVARARRYDPRIRGLDRHGVIKLGLSGDSDVEENVDRTEFETLRALSQSEPQD